MKIQLNYCLALRLSSILLPKAVLSRRQKRLLFGQWIASTAESLWAAVTPSLSFPSILAAVWLRLHFHFLYPAFMSLGSLTLSCFTVVPHGILPWLLQQLANWFGGLSASSFALSICLGLSTGSQMQTCWCCILAENVCNGSSSL